MYTIVFIDFLFEKVMYMVWEIIIVINATW